MIATVRTGGDPSSGELRLGRAARGGPFRRSLAPFAPTLVQKAPTTSRPGRSRFPQCRSSRVSTLRAVTRSIAASEELWERAQRAIPLGTQTLSKSPTQFVDGVSPKFLARGAGGRGWDAGGNEYVDWPMARRPILLGYDEPAVSAAAIEQLRAGTTFTLMHPVEVEVAEALIQVIPCAEQVRFAKNGADATGGAVRAARALTGREHVVACGYHGFHDWYIASTERNDGVPRHDAELIASVRFADLDALRAALGQHVAAVIMEIPGTEPPPGYLQAAIDLAHQAAPPFILDEIAPGSRPALGAAQEPLGSRPGPPRLTRAIRARRSR